MLFLLLIISFPSTYGGKGIYRVKSADLDWLLGARSILILNTDAEGYRYDYRDSTIDFGEGRVGIGYVPTNYLEVYTLWRAQGYGNARLPINTSDFSGDLGDTDLGLKLILKKIRNSYFGTDATLTLPTGRQIYSNERLIFYPKFLMTFDLADIWSMLPLRSHLNLGTPLGRADLSEHFPITFGFAWELPSKFFTHFMELTKNHQRDWNWRLSPGLKFHPWHRFCLTVAVDFGLSEEMWLIGANAGLSINSSLLREREIVPTGNIAGEVRDKNTNKPLKAKITVIEINEVVECSPDYGVYKLIGLPAGIYTLKVDCPYYTTETRVLALEANQSLIANFNLTRSQVSLEGVVRDLKTEQPLSDVSINITGPVNTMLISDSTGLFTTTLIPGDYEISANKLNYTQFKTKVLITEDRKEAILLKPIEVAEEIKETPEAIIYFDFDDANIREDQKPELDRIAEFLKNHPGVRCELRGHTDSRGNINYNQILSLARANSAMDYLVKVHGIEKERISTMAFSKTKLIKESPEKSRRVEIFLIR